MFTTEQNDAMAIRRMFSKPSHKPGAIKAGYAERNANRPRREFLLSRRAEDVYGFDLAMDLEVVLSQMERDERNAKR